MRPGFHVTIIDGSNLCHRHHHARKNTNRRANDETPTWAIWGMLCALDKLTSQATHLVVAVDHPTGSQRRKDQHPDYKANRTAPEEDLATQLARYPEIFANAGITTIARAEHEADDIIASVWAQTRARDGRVTIVTSDRDAYQLLDEHTRITSGDGTFLDRDSIHERYGIPAHLYPHVAALRGEPGDGLVGIPRIGQKTATALVAHFGDDIAQAVSDRDALCRVLSPKLADIVVEHHERYRTNLALGELDRTIDVLDELKHCKLPLDRARFTKALKPFGLHQAATRIGRILT